MGALISKSIRDEGELVIRVNLLLVYHSQVGGSNINSTRVKGEQKNIKRELSGDCSCSDAFEKNKFRATTASSIISLCLFHLFSSGQFECCIVVDKVVSMACPATYTCLGFTGTTSLPTRTHSVTLEGCVIHS